MPNARVSPFASSCDKIRSSSRSIFLKANPHSCQVPSFIQVKESSFSQIAFSFRTFKASARAVAPLSMFRLISTESAPCSRAVRAGMPKQIPKRSSSTASMYASFVFAVYRGEPSGGKNSSLRVSESVEYTQPVRDSGEHVYSRTRFRRA